MLQHKEAYTQGDTFHVGTILLKAAGTSTKNLILVYLT